MNKILQVEALEGYKLSLSFQDGSSGVVDLSSLIDQPVFSAWKEQGAFAAVRISETGELEWACGVDLCADALYLQVTGKSPEEIFPALTRQTAHA